MAGGNEQSKISMGLSYNSQEGILGNRHLYPKGILLELTLIVLLKNSSFDVIKLGENLTYSYQESDGIGNQYGNDIRYNIVEILYYLFIIRMENTITRMIKQ